jgi:hypothetical protein
MFLGWVTSVGLDNFNRWIVTGDRMIRTRLQNASLN